MLRRLSFPPRRTLFPASQYHSIISPDPHCPATTLLLECHRSSVGMTRILSRLFPHAFSLASYKTVAFRSLPHSVSSFVPSASDSLTFSRRFPVLCGADRNPARTVGGTFTTQRGYRKVRHRLGKKKKKELELNVRICIEEELPDDPEILSLAEMLRLNVPMAMKLAFDGLKDSEYKTRDTTIDDVGGFDTVELSVLLCNDEFIQKLNKDWRDEDHATDVLSMSQHIPELNLPILMLGDIVISVETTARQAEERAHTILDEIRILMIHGLLHLLGFDHEVSDEAEAEMEKEEELLLKSLGWKGKGLIQSAYDATNKEGHQLETSDGELSKERKREGSLRFYKPKFSYIFCDVDGTLLNNRSQVSPTTAKALKEAVSRGVKVVIATGKTRAAVTHALKMVDLAGKDGIISEFSPGVFLQGLLVYGRQGQEIFRGNLDPNLCREAFLYSWEQKVPLIAFSQDRCLTLFDHPLVDCLHTVYHEPKAEVMPSVEHLLTAAEIQKLIFLDTAEGVAMNLRPYWSEATKGHGHVVQAMPDMLEIVPPGTSKGSGVRMLLDHLGVTTKEVMAIGDGENDVEMLELASLGVALSNGSEKAKSVANVIGCSNDEDGVADAIYRYAF
ncbi:endoribonuclease YBEY, chloroplastic-like isoform X2 [Telopea speciosissima]|uniref:endoribonuclease YBEY, chloroplastic-like isoform X2 n=1 Tax=Telopea speciosissima TaxID=54955 RepID=UPI001CC5660E|nr:endoribonuclease YBEY, chloroplastic-like isoform X2 [Telopea speciosissima]